MRIAVTIRMFWLATAAFTGVAFSCAAPASAQIAHDDPRLKTDQIQYEYVTPTKPEQMPLYETMKKTQVLEKFKEILAPLRLPKPMIFKTETCGIANSYFDID